MNFYADILILKIEENMQHFQHIMLYYFKQVKMLYYFKKGKNASETEKKKICAVYGEGTVTDQMCQKWFPVGLSYALEDTEQHPWPLHTRNQ